MRFQEFEKQKGLSLASRTIRNYARELGADSMDYGMFMKSADLLDKDMLKSLAKHIEDSDTAPREYVMKKIADHNPEIFKKMYGDQEGYLSLMKPQKDLKDDDNSARGMNKYGLAARHKDGKFHSYRHGKHTGSFDSAEELAKHQQELIQNESQPDGGAERAEAAKGIWASSKEIQSRFKTWQDFMNSEDFDEYLDDKFRDQLGEDAPFGSGMELLRMAIMKKFISVQEWDLLKHKWKDAAAEVEEKYSDWPEGEGFGSSDHNFAIRDLMTAVGYEFDDQDTSGRFVVTKQPEEIEKAGIKNARMKGVKDPEQDHREISRIMKYEDAGEKIANMAQSMSKDEFMSHADELGLTPEEAAEHYEKMQGGAHAGKFEDEGGKFTFGQIAKAKAYAKTYANDMTSAVKNIEAIATGLSKHPEVADTLKRANENQELNRITKLAGLGEGADFYGYYKDPKDPSGKTMTYPDDMEFKTPHRSNANARMLLSRIGLDPDFENTGSTPIDDFIAATDKYLRMNVSDKDNPQYDEVEIYDIEAKRIKKAHPEVTHVGFN